MGTQPYLAWKVMAKVKRGLSHHNTAPANKSLRKPDESLTSIDKEYADTLSSHFSTIFSRIDITFDPSVLSLLPNTPVHAELDSLPSMDKLQQTLHRLPNYKAPGPNDLTTDALKVLSASLPDDALPSHPILSLLSILQKVWRGGTPRPNGKRAHFAPFSRRETLRAREISVQSSSQT